MDVIKNPEYHVSKEHRHLTVDRHNYRLEMNESKQSGFDLFASFCLSIMTNTYFFFLCSSNFVELRIRYIEIYGKLKGSLVDQLSWYKKQKLLK
ncbi:MAG: hypothetical protein ICV66_14215 [Chitinophagaceae bacterium]|nr:hypothetical protein [Chitinophagaceae bacterium]